MMVEIMPLGRWVGCERTAWACVRFDGPHRYPNRMKRSQTTKEFFQQDHSEWKPDAYPGRCVEGLNETEWYWAIFSSLLDRPPRSSTEIVSNRKYSEGNRR